MTRPTDLSDLSDPSDPLPAQAQAPASPSAGALRAAPSAQAVQAVQAVQAAQAAQEDRAVAPLWQAGWYRFARRLDSPNFGPRPAGACIDLAVVHSISLPPGRYGGEEVQRLFTNTLDWEAHPYFQQIRGLQVSAHFFIRRGGELWQFVSCDDRAWHAGTSRWQGRDNCNDFSIGIELEGLEGDSFEPAQYEALAALASALAQAYPIAHMAGHEHVAPGRKADPGPGFDWACLQRQLGWAQPCFPEVLGPVGNPTQTQP